MTYTLDTTLGELLDDPQAEAVLDKYVPGVSTNPLIAMAKGFSLKMVLAMPQAAQFGLTEEKAEQILAEINKRTKGRRPPASASR
jgi:hypothetical protein